MSLRALIAGLPLLTVLGLAGVEMAQAVPVANDLRAYFEHVGECANQRMMDATAVADGYDPGTAPPSVFSGDPVVLPLAHERTVASVAYAPVEYCGRPIVGTIVTLSDGTSAKLPGRARLVRVASGTAEFRLS